MAKLPLTDREIEFIIEQLQNGQQLPEDLKYKLFPTKQKEYELVYGGKMRKEDILANEDGVFPIPLQVGKLFNGERESWGDGWKNMIVFGDNLQFLKTIYENKDPLVKDKIKGKVKLIYIDPPFGTGDEYGGNKGQKGYTAKVKGADFIEFLRRRVLVANEILQNEGFIAVRQAFNFGHYVKIVLDEIFGKESFINEIVIGRKREGAGTRNKLDVTNESIFVYSKSSTYKINPVFAKRPLTDIKWTSFLMGGERNPRERTFLGLVLFPPPGQHFSLIQEKCNKLLKENFLRVRCTDCGARYYYAESNEDLDKKMKRKQDKFKFYDITSDTNYFATKKLNDCISCKSRNFVVDYLGSDDIRVNNNWLDIRSYSGTTGYPTENSEELLYRIIQLFSKEGDIIFDFFGGSGTLASVAEKLNRKWIVCDIGKLSFYTMQKRLININQSKDLESPQKRYNKSAKSFFTLNTGCYDLEKIFNLKLDNYKNFVLELFEVDDLNGKKIGGVSIDGQKKDGFYTIIYPYWKFKESSVDEDYLEDLHSHIGKKIGNRLYIIAPANSVDFISDYHVIEDVRYYFLKVPYQVIKELHKVDFKKFRQPQSKSNVNDLEDAIGFHFIRQPKVISELKPNKDKLSVQLKEFYSDFTEEETGKDMANFESLAMVLIDKNYNGEAFEMDEYYFAEDLLPKKKKKKDEDEENIKEVLRKQKIISIELNIKDCGNKLMVIYIDIYGNEFKEVLSLK